MRCLLVLAVALAASASAGANNCDGQPNTLPIWSGVR